MKHFIKILVLIGIVVLSSCGGSNNRQVKYNPSDRSKYSSDEERELAIAQKKAEASGLLSQNQYTNAVKLCIMVPKVDENYPLAAAQSLTMQMLKITAANGIAGYGGNPAFVFAAIVNPVQEGITSTIPKKNYINYKVTFYVTNIHSGDVFGTLEQEVMGVGSSKEQAVVNAMEHVKNDAALSALLSSSSEKIVSWYDLHAESLIAEVQHYIRTGDYNKAYCLLVSVPEGAERCQEFAKKHMDSVHELYLEQMSDSYYKKMQDAIAGANGAYDPNVAALMEMIPCKSSVYGSAVAAYDAYVESVITNGNAERAHQMYMEEESIALQKLQAEAEIKAQEALMMQQEQAGMEQQETEDGGFLGEVGNGIKSMLIDKAYSLVMGGVSTFLSFL